MSPKTFLYCDGFKDIGDKNRSRNIAMAIMASGICGKSYSEAVSAFI